MIEISTEVIVRALDGIIAERNGLTHQVAKAHSRIYAVWKLHQPITHEGRKVCAHSLSDYPCETIKALNSDAS